MRMMLSPCMCFSMCMNACVNERLIDWRWVALYFEFPCIFIFFTYLVRRCANFRRCVPCIYILIAFNF